MNGTTKEKYLIYAEDDIDDREVFREMMHSINEEIGVVTFDEGSEVISYLSSLEPDDFLPRFILLDINMPGMDGFSTLKALKNNPAYSDIAVVMFSTANQVRETLASQELGASRFITKPFSMSHLEEIAREFASFCEAAPAQRKERVV